MIAMLMKALPLIVTAGGTITAFSESNPIVNYAKSTMVSYEITTMSRFVIYKAIGKGIVPNEYNFSEYLRNTMESSRDASLDLWESPYVLKTNGQNFTIISAGPDKILKTDDDISNTFLMPIR